MAARLGLAGPISGHGVDFLYGVSGLQETQEERGQSLGRLMIRHGITSSHSACQGSHRPAQIQRGHTATS